MQLLVGKLGSAPSTRCEPPAPHGIGSGMTAPMWVVCMCVSFPWRSKLIWSQEHGICPQALERLRCNCPEQSIPLPLVLAFDLFKSCGAASLFQCLEHLWKSHKGPSCSVQLSLSLSCDYIFSFCLQANVLALVNLFHKLAALSHIRGGSCPVLICMFPGGSVIRIRGKL